MSQQIPSLLDSHGERRIFERSASPYDGMIFSSAGRLRITRVAPLSCTRCFFLNSEKRRLTVFAGGADDLPNLLVAQREFETKHDPGNPWIWG
jgi:hypothetical protein